MTIAPVEGHDDGTPSGEAGAPGRPVTGRRPRLPSGAPVADVAKVSWSGLEIRHLHALLVVAEEANFSRAAERLGYTQSAVSQQVRALEQIVGAPLFERPGGPRPVTLTPEGAALAAHAHVVLARVDEAASELRALVDGGSGTLRVGTVQSVGRHILPELLRRFRREAPGVQVRLEESQDPVVLRGRLESGHLDLMFAPLPAPEGALLARSIVEDPFVLLAPADSPEAGRGTVTLEEVVALPLVGYRSDWCRTIVAERLAGVPTPDYVFESDDNPTIQGIVGAGGAYSMVTLLSIDPEDAATAVVPIDPPVEPRRVAVMWPSDRHLPAALDRFVETAASVCEDLSLLDRAGVEAR